MIYIFFEKNWCIKGVLVFLKKKREKSPQFMRSNHRIAGLGLREAPIQ